MADTKLAKVGITVKESWKDDISYEVLDYTLWRVQDGGDGCGYIAKRANIGVVPNSDDSVWIKATQAGQSIYDLAVKYGHFVGTEEEFEAEYQAVLQAARDAASETSATNTEIQEAEELRRASEDERAAAETARQESEITREATESDRQIAENIRQMAETQRGENETTRQSQETARESSETQRQSNESTRQSNETARESAEQERTADFEALKTDMETAIGEADAATAAAVALNNQVAGDESARQQAEQSRVAAETQRQNAETQRGTNEQTRQTQETARQTAEQTRNTQEGTRQTQETARQTAEEGRASSESQRVSNETARQTAETARETQATTDHQRADSDHAIAEEDHATLDEKISHKADIDGSYDGMAVGIARNLEGRTDVTDSFFKRTTGGDAEVANGTAQLNEVKGKSLVWNQLISVLASDSYTSDGITFTINANGSITVRGTATATVTYMPVQAIIPRFPIIAGHKYLKVGFEDALVCCWSDRNGRLTQGNGIVTPAVGGEDNFIFFRVFSGKTIDTTFYPQLIDLTLLGIDNLTTVEEVEAWLAENIGEQAYYPYNSGEVLNNKMTGVESIGFNLLDPATGKADIIGAYSDVYGNYYGITGTHGALTFTDKFGNTETITPDEDGKFLLEKAGTLSVADAGEDCAVFLWWDGTQTEYKPYEKNVGALDVTHIYGKLNGEGEYVRVWPTGMPGIGDIKDSLKVVDGQVVAERKVGEVDLGTLTYSLSSDIFFPAPLDGMSTENDVNGVLCGKYKPRNSRAVKEDKAMYRANGRPFFQDSACVDAASFKSSNAGVLLYYELETPRIFTDLIYRDSGSFADNTPVTLPVNYKVDNWGIERIAPQNTEEAVVTTKPELTMRYSIDAVEELNTHRDEIDDLYEKNEELDQRKPEKYGEYPDMAVGSAKTLAGQDTKIEDFFFKALDCADGLAKLNSARGKSLVWNQLIRNGNFADGTNDWKITNSDNINVSDGVLSLENTITDNAVALTPQNTTRSISGHKYLLRFKYNFDASIGSDIVFAFTGVAFTGSVTCDGAFHEIKRICSSNNNQAFNFFFRPTTITGAILKFSNFSIIDLTLMFGAGNEPATVAEFEAMFPLPYYDYNPGEIISNKTEEVKVTGFNQWDEEWEDGGIENDGSKNSATNYRRSKNYIPVFPGVEYYFKEHDSEDTGSLTIYFYDSNKNFISSDSVPRRLGGVKTMPANARFMLFKVWKTTYVLPICINLSDPARNGEYEPYKTNTIELNLPTLTGKLNGEGESVVVFPDGLKSAGSAYDEIVGNKAIKRVGVVDLGSLSWSAPQNLSYFYTDELVSVIAIRPTNSGADNIICPKYITIGAAYTKIVQQTEDKLMVVIWATSASKGRLMIRDSSYTSEAAFKTAMSGVLLYYELATPEEYILDAPIPDTFQAYKGGTIKQLPENTSEPVTAPCVLTATYAIDAVSTLVGLPRNYVSKESLQAMLNAMQSAGIIASYTMTYNENTGKYDFTFVAPTNS